MKRSYQSIAMPYAPPISSLIYEKICKSFCRGSYLRPYPILSYLIILQGQRSHNQIPDRPDNFYMQEAACLSASGRAGCTFNPSHDPNDPTLQVWRLEIPRKIICEHPGWLDSAACVLESS